MKLKNLLYSMIIFSLPMFVNAQNALDFDGVDDYVQTNYTGLTGTAPRTVEAWIKTGFVGTQTIITDMGDMSISSRFTLNIINGFLRIEVVGNGFNGTTLVADNQWHHVAVTYDGGFAANQFKLYIDGNLDNSGNVSTRI